MKRRWVIKAGSNLVCTGGPLLVRAWMQQVSALRRDYGIEVIWVTSGAIASAADRVRLLGGKQGGQAAKVAARPKRELSEKQALSAIGQPIVMDLYNLALQATGALGAQILLTYDDLADAGRRANFRNTVEELLKWGITPVLNENDAVATEEIRFGDNDSLSARVAKYADADELVILTDVDGLYDEDPRNNPKARLIAHLAKIDDRVLAKVDPGAGSSRGTGGMYSKLRAAREACDNGIATNLVRGDVPGILLRLAANESVGTRVDAGGTRRKDAGGARSASKKTPAAKKARQ